jgi:D-3-phosphoglycerate dehydrogenase / 2-oxoglutarate reductase
MSAKVLITDYAWPDLEIERNIIEGAGLSMASGPATPASAHTIGNLVAMHQPAAILTNWAPVDAAAIAASTKLRIVGRLGVGLDNIAVEECTARGIWVTNVPDYCVEEVSDHAVGMVLAWARGIVAFDRAVHSGEWKPETARLKRLSTLTCGIVGFGKTGRATARKLAAFQCRLLVNTRRVPTDAAQFEFVDLGRLLRESDVIILHLPLDASTRHLINGSRLEAMKRGAVLVNMSRGGLVDTAALIEALQSRKLGAAMLDVLETEPDVPPALLALSNVVLTPHVAFSSDASLAELRRRAAEEVVRVLAGGAPLNPRNDPARKPD